MVNDPAGAAVLLQENDAGVKPGAVAKLALHGPHQAAATYSVPPTLIPSSGVTSPAELPPTAVRTSKILLQPVEAPVPAVVPAMPASEFQKIAPPANRQPTAAFVVPALGGDCDDSTLYIFC